MKTFCSTELFPLPKLKDLFLDYQSINVSWLGTGRVHNVLSLRHHSAFYRIVQSILIIFAQKWLRTFLRF